MNKIYLKETRMLNYKHSEIQYLIKQRNWQSLDEFNKIKEIYTFVQNDILLGFNSDDFKTSIEVLEEGIGQCNTKATLLMSLLRAVGIACRLHAFEVSKDFQKGVTTGIVSVLAPKRIVHTWVEVYYQEKWVALEGVIIDKVYLSAIQNKYRNIQGSFNYYAIATLDLNNPPIDWIGEDTFIQKEAIVFDYGIFESPDVFFETHKQYWGKLKQYLYANIGRKLMNRNVNKIRKSI